MKDESGWLKEGFFILHPSAFILPSQRPFEHVPAIAARADGPAVFADEGPSNIIGEASFATAKALGINPDPSNGGVDSGVTYIVFPKKVPSPVESNSAIDSAGAAAANAFVNG